MWQENLCDIKLKINKKFTVTEDDKEDYRDKNFLRRKIQYSSHCRENYSEFLEVVLPPYSQRTETRGSIFSLIDDRCLFMWKYL